MWYDEAMKWLLNQYRLTSDRTYRKELSESNISHNTNRFMVLSVLVCVFESIFLIWSFLPSAVDFLGDYLQFYRSMYLAAVLYSAFTFLLLWRYERWTDERKFTRLTMIMMLALAIFLNWSMLITIVDMVRGIYGTVYFFVCLAISIVIIMRPSRSLALYGTSFTFFLILNTLLVTDRGLLISSYLNGSSIIATSWVISAILYYYRGESFVKELIIQEKNKQLAKVASMDSLTGLYNRRSLDEALIEWFEEAQSKGETLSVMMLDVDYFKGYNDTYGHVAGDQVLVTIAKTVKDITGNLKSHTSRYGGDELCILYSGMTEDEIDQIEQLIKAETERLAIVNKASRSDRVLTVSIGSFTGRPVAGVDPWSYIHRADRQLYVNKGKRLNRRRGDWGREANE